jgi:sec-independent protein translocase protein TatA
LEIEMGLSGAFSIWHLLIVLVIAITIFGTKRLKTLGGDLGGAVKSFRQAMDQGDSEDLKRIESRASDGDLAEQKGAELAEQKNKVSPS